MQTGIHLTNSHGIYHVSPINILKVCLYKFDQTDFLEKGCEDGFLLEFTLKVLKCRNDKYSYSFVFPVQTGIHLTTSHGIYQVSPINILTVCLYKFDQTDFLEEGCEDGFLRSQERQIKIRFCLRD